MSWVPSNWQPPSIPSPPEAPPLPANVTQDPFDTAFNLTRLYNATVTILTKPTASINLVIDYVGMTMFCTMLYILAFALGTMQSKSVLGGAIAMALLFPVFLMIPELRIVGTISLLLGVASVVVARWLGIK